jgi:twitching motility protein PilT
MEASDIHWTVDSPLLFRIHGELVAVSEELITLDYVQQTVEAFLPDGKTKMSFKNNKELDTSYKMPDGGRLRLNFLHENGYPSIVARLIPEGIPTMEEMALPAIAKQSCFLDHGLILFTGPTGSGKSTSMASMVKAIQDERSVHIMTLEDPIEFTFPKKTMGLVRQRQLGEDFLDFPEALKRVLRQDPDVVLIGEMRDLDTISAALTLAETGHLVFGTLHTPNAIETINRIVDVFPPHQQTQIRTQLSLTMQVIFAQKLLPKAEGGRVPVREVLVNNPAVANMIRDNRTAEIVSAMQTGNAEGMTTFAKALEGLLQNQQISQETYEWAMIAVAD